MPFLRADFMNCHSSGASDLATSATWSRSALSVKWAPYVQQPCTSSGVGSVQMPWHPHPKMHCHDESRNVTSICHVRPSSPGSANVTHSRAGPAPFLPLLVPLVLPLLDP